MTRTNLETLFEKLIVGDYVEFLTLPAYQQID